MIPKKWMLAFICCFLFGLLIPAYEGAAVERAPEHALNLPTPFAEAVDLGAGPLAGQSQGAAIGDGELYFANSGSPAVFYAVDSESGEVIYSQTMPGLDVVWAITIGSDGNVYFAGTSNGIVYRYLPEEKKIEELGVNASGDKWIWELEASNDGKIYGATYPRAKVFELDIETKEYKDLGRLHPDQKYTRGLGITDEALYAGTGSTAYLYRFDRETGEKTEIPTPVTGTTTMISNIWEYNDRLFVVNGTSLHILDHETFEPIRSLTWQDDIASDGYISPPSPDNPDVVYFKNKNTFHLWSYNMKTDKLEKVGAGIDLPTTSTRSMKWLTTKDEEGREKHVLALMSNRNEYVVIDLEKETSTVLYPDVELSGLDIQALEIAPDGKVYMSGYQGSIAVYDPKENKYILQKRDPHQIEGMGFLDGKVYMGAYGGARIYEYDPQAAYNFTKDNDSNNPKLIHTIPQGQSRPFAFASGDGMLFAGTVPDYGKLGGTFSMYDAATGQWHDEEHIIQDQSIIGLAYNNGKVFGGSGIFGGLGIEPSQQTAKMFEFDVKSKKTDIFELAIPGFKIPQMIGELSFGPDGLLWGIAWGQDDQKEDAFAIFAMDQKTKKVEKHRILLKGNKKGSSWRPFFIRWGEDGLMYTTIARQLIAFDPDSLESAKVLDEPVNLMDVDQNGNIYYAKGSNLMMLPVALHAVEMKVKKPKIKVGEPLKIQVEARLANGKKVDSSGFKVTYESSDRSVIEVVDGQIVGKSIGRASIKATIDMYGQTMTTEPLSVRVQPGHYPHKK